MQEGKFKQLWENPPRFQVIGNEPWPDKIVVGGTVVAEAPPFSPEKLYELLTDEAGMRRSWIDDYIAAWERCKADPNCQGVTMLKRRISPRVPTVARLRAHVESFPDFLKKEPLGESKQKVKHNPRPSRFGFLEGLKNHKSR